jgi:hypothetical protein
VLYVYVIIACSLKRKFMWHSSIEYWVCYSMFRSERTKVFPRVAWPGHGWSGMLHHATTESSTTSKQNIRTNFACAICAEYGHYTHHFPSITYVCHTLVVEHHTYLPELPMALHINAPVNVIHYISSSILEKRGGPCPPTNLPPDRP